MTELLTLRSYREEFARRAERRREDLHRDVDRQRRDEKKKEAREAREDADADADALALMLLASPPEIAAFSETIDTYDTATIEALLDNEEAMALVREELRIMMDKAYVLPDGRRVFKTEDGTRIYDEHGSEVEGFDPDAVEDWRPTWEQLTAARAQQQALVEERNALHAFQGRLDEARDRLDDDGLTKEELDDLRQSLEEDMPHAVRARLAEEHVGPQAPSRTGVDPLGSATPSTDSAARAPAAAKLEMPAL